MGVQQLILMASWKWESPCSSPMLKFSYLQKSNIAQCDNRPRYWAKMLSSWWRYPQHYIQIFMYHCLRTWQGNGLTSVQWQIINWCWILWLFSLLFNKLDVIVSHYSGAHFSFQQIVAALMRQNLQEAEWQCVSSCHRLIILLLICLLPLAYPVLISAPPLAPSFTPSLVHLVPRPISIIVH